MTKLPSHVPAEIIISATGIPRRTFYQRVISKGVLYIQMYRSDRLYDVKNWNSKNPDYVVAIGT